MTEAERIHADAATPDATAFLVRVVQGLMAVLAAWGRARQAAREAVFNQLKTLWAAWTAYDTAVDAAKEAGVDPKNILTSKLFWFGLLTGGLGLLQQSGILSSLPATWGPGALQIIGGVTIILRYLTTQPVKLPSL